MHVSPKQVVGYWHVACDYMQQSSKNKNKGKYRTQKYRKIQDSYKNTGIYRIYRTGILLEQRLRVSAGQSACTPFTPYCRLGLPAFQCVWIHWTRKLAAEQSESKSRGLFGEGSVAADGVSSQNLRHWSAASSYWLIGSGKPRHTEPSDWSAIPKRLTMVVKGKGGHVELGLD